MPSDSSRATSARSHADPPATRLAYWSEKCPNEHNPAQNIKLYRLHSASSSQAAASSTGQAERAYSGPAFAPSQLVRIQGQDCREFRHQQPSTSPYTRGGC